MNKIAAVVVTFNRKELLSECVDALLNQTYEEFDILVIDNASTDGTADLFINNQNERIKYINTGANLGGAGGFNFGIKEAYARGYDYYWLMDDDSIASPTALEEVVKTSDKLNGEYGFICSRVDFTDNTPCLMNVPDLLDEYDSDIQRATRATFVGFYTRREVVLDIGLPIKEFFIWADDTNYSLRINKKYKNYYASSSVIVHKMKVNSAANIKTDNSGRYQRYFYAYRNRRVNARINHKRIRYHLSVIKASFQILFHGRHKFKRWFYMYKGFFAGIFFRPKVEYLEKK